MPTSATVTIGNMISEISRGNLLQLGGIKELLIGEIMLVTETDWIISVKDVWFLALIVLFLMIVIAIVIMRLVLVANGAEFGLKLQGHVLYDSIYLNDVGSCETWGSDGARLLILPFLNNLCVGIYVAGRNKS